jgi:hypothetical protein
MTMDELAERMVEHGFLDAPDENRPGDSGLHNRIRDMIDAELRGKPVRPIHEQAEAETAPQAANEDDRDEGLRTEVRGCSPRPASARRPSRNSRTRASSTAPPS